MVLYFKFNIFPNFNNKTVWNLHERKLNAFILRMIKKLGSYIKKNWYATWRKLANARLALEKRKTGKVPGKLATGEFYEREIFHIYGHTPSGLIPQ